jgi:ABC-2 type transport system permease protein
MTMASDMMAAPSGTTVAQRAPGLPVTTWVLRQQRRALAGWSVALAAVCAIYVGFYPAMGGADLGELVEGLPPGLVQALGYEDIASAAGYLDSTVYSLLGPALMLVFAIGFGARVLAGEEEEGTLELEFTLPVDRRRVLLERFLAMVAQLLVLGGVVFVVVAAMVLTLDMDVAAGNVASATLGLFLLALAMGTVALGVGAAVGRKAAGLAAGAGLAVASFMANALAPLVEGAGWLENVSPFGWYLGGEPLRQGIDWAGFGGLAAITVVVLAVVLPIFARRDLGV